MGAKRKFREGLTNDVTHDQGVLLIHANGGGGVRFMLSPQLQWE